MELEREYSAEVVNEWEEGGWCCTAPIIQISAKHPIKDPPSVPPSLPSATVFHPFPKK